MSEFQPRSETMGPNPLLKDLLFQVAYGSRFLPRDVDVIDLGNLADVMTEYLTISQSTPKKELVGSLGYSTAEGTLLIPQKPTVGKDGTIMLEDKERNVTRQAVEINGKFALPAISIHTLLAGYTLTSTELTAIFAK
ncbi:MAG TPA: hypothetical protein VG917_04660 [Patescibacteria group bacterium]|nr:hypothetical protein [Patescibacteria group bacterium]